MRELTKVLSHEASMKSDALKGIHHAVLGFGSTTCAQRPPPKSSSSTPVATSLAFLLHRFAVTAAHMPAHALAPARRRLSTSRADTTFQNVPRLTDKFLGECGSRRLAMRAEIDEHDDNPGEEAEYYRWGKEVFEALQALPATTAPPACAWSQPAARVAPLNSDDDDEAGGVPLTYVVGGLLLGLMCTSYWYFTQQ